MEYYLFTQNEVRMHDPLILSHSLLFFFFVRDLPVRYEYVMLYIICKKGIGWNGWMIR